MAAPCMHAGGLLAAGQTTASWISELGIDGDRHWATGSSSPCLSLWRPVKLNEPIDTGEPTGQPDERSLWWRHERINRRLIRHGTPAAQFAVDREQTQAALFAEPAAGWDLAEAWLARQESVSPDAVAIAMPWWLRSYWGAVDRQARSTLLPWRDA